MRFNTLDLLRGLAVYAMVTYHFFWDLGFFGYIDLSYITRGLGLLVAQIVGASFILISGISLQLSGLSIRNTYSFWKRFAKLCFFAAAISIVTLSFDRNNFIFFGILHLLAISSLIGFVMKKYDNFYFLVFILFISVLLTMSGLKFNLPSYFSWIGLNTSLPTTNDFYPIFPWINYYIFGLLLGKIIKNKLPNNERFSNKVNVKRKGLIYVTLIFSGKNSLIIYILHQPIFFSLFLLSNRIGF